jgi:DNA repair protein RecN (Recombination protein N)
MLSHLRVSNLGILTEAAIDPSPGFTVITGETGAGKTLLLGGLRLILGGKADAGAVGPADDTAQADGVFVDGDDEIGVSRIVPRSGRSRAHLEGAIVSAAVLEERLGGMVEIVGQHDQLLPTRSSYLLDLIDGTLDDGGMRTRRAYDAAWAGFQEARARREALGGDQIALARELDLTRYQAAEIAKAGLVPGLDEQLETDLSRLRNLEEIQEHLAETVRTTAAMADMAGELVARLRKTSGLDPSLAGLAEEAEGLAASVSELSRAANTAADGLDLDASGLEELEQRLTAIGDLKRKYGRTLEEVISYGEGAARRAKELETLLGEADRIDETLDNARARLVVGAGSLRQAREKASRSVSERMAEHLADLGLETAWIAFSFTEVEPGPGGADRVAIRFASDARLEPGDISAVASGGELSRLVLALRLSARAPGAATLVFDEVDIGIGGKTALAMGAKLAELAGSNQVLCVTHLPQVAACADTHYVVERSTDGGAAARLVDGEDRVAEIARMLAGLPESEAGRMAAAELLARSR